MQGRYCSAQISEESSASSQWATAASLKQTICVVVRVKEVVHYANIKSCATALHVAFYRDKSRGMWEAAPSPRSAPCTRLFGKSCSSAMLSPRAEEVDVRILGAWGMFCFSESFKSLLVLSVLVETAVLPMKASEDLLICSQMQRGKQLLVLFPSKLLTMLTDNQLPFPAFIPGLLNPWVSQQFRHKTQTTIPSVFILHFDNSWISQHQLQTIIVLY